MAEKTNFFVLTFYIKAWYNLAMDKNNQQQNKKFKRIVDAVSQPLILENWYSETFPSNFVMEFHTHPQIEIMYCVNGKFDFVYKFKEDDTESSFVTINQNCFIVVNNGYYHKIANLEHSTKIINLEFLPYGDSIKNMDTMPIQLKVFPLSIEKIFSVCSSLQRLLKKDKNFYTFVDNNNVLGKMQEIVRKMKESDATPERSLQISLLTTNLFIDMSHCISPETHKKTGIIYVDSAMAYINSHFLDKIRVSEIASAVGVSSVYLQKLFRSQYGKNIHDIVIEKRIGQAKHLLEQSNLSIAEIAKQCGFGCREQLVYEFQKLENKSPSSYRKETSTQKFRFFSHYGEKKIIDDKYN